MNTIEKMQQMAGVPSFVGVFPRDRLPSRTPRPAGLIVNTDKSTSEGTHWIAYFIGTDGQSELFDPLGSPPPRNEIMRFMLRNGNKGWPSITWNNIAFQSDTSWRCGAFCIYYLKRRLGGSSICEIVTSLSADTSVNDSIVRHG